MSVPDWPREATAAFVIDALRVRVILGFSNTAVITGPVGAPVDSVTGLQILNLADEDFADVQSGLDDLWDKISSNDRATGRLVWRLSTDGSEVRTLSTWEFQDLSTSIWDCCPSN